MFTFERMTNPQHVFNKAFPASFIYPQSLGLAAQISSIKKIDQRTVDFELKTANAAFLSYFAMAFSAIHSAEYAQQLLLNKRAADINNYPIGTGPYRFRSYKKDDVIRMEANPDYWRGPQITQKLIYSISREPNVRVQKLRLGECNITAPIRDVDITVLDGNPRVKVAKIQALNISYLSFNLRKAPTNNRLVREALDIAVDRDALFRVLFPRGDAMQAISAFPPSIPGYNKQLRNEYNPARARQLLASAGFKDNIELDLWALPVSRPTNPNGQLMAQMIQQDWAKIGVKAHIKTYEWGEYLKRAAKGEHDVYMSGWSGDSGDPDDFLATNLTCALNKNGVKFCNKEFDAMVEAGRSTTDPQRRAAYYEKAQVIFKYERPWMTMAHSTVYIPMSQKLEGFIMAPNGSVSFENVYVRP
jgi:peptide/nickel transport system substrate-binding protein/dipeptide transport system substrate-binding protein